MRSFIAIRFLLFVIILLSGLKVSRAEFGDILADDEQEVEKIILGSRGALIFANQVRDVIEGTTSGRIYLARVNEAPRMIMEEDGQVIDDVWYVDLTGDSLKEVAVSWEYPSEGSLARFEVFSVTATGRLKRLFPSEENGKYSALGTAQVKGDGPGLANGAAFSLSRNLCQVTKQEPQLSITTSYRYVSGRFVSVDETTDELVSIGQRLNFAAHNYSKGDFKRGLQIARSALEGVRISGPRNLLGDAYSLVAKGYKMCGKPELAALYKKRADLTILSRP